jgi:hypothetical protein
VEPRTEQIMQMPFSQSEFYDVFAAYNERLWPFAAGLWLVVLAATVVLVKRRRVGPSMNVVLFWLWAWAGIAYHAAFFTRINPAARGFAVLFVVQALLFLWVGVQRRRVAFGWERSPRHALGLLLAGYALAYPLLTLPGHPWPGVPSFGVPCPTTLFTAGVLLMAEPRVPRPLVVVPVAWCVVGGSAALLFRVIPDLMLFPAGVLLALWAFAPRTLSPSAET